MTATFTRMDQSTAEEWAAIGAETSRNQGRVADRILMLLESLSDITDGFATDQLTHCLQTATLAERAGADDEVIVASLCHDIGKAISVPNHGAIAAEMLKPYVRPDVFHMIKNHQDFQGRHYYGHFGMRTDLREQFRDEPWYALCEATPSRSPTSSRSCVRSSPALATERRGPPARPDRGRRLRRPRCR
ncbi:MAG: HD domain-containing protein [Actinobacteria bacterium]|nr:HD domain-containing protein [Actinomycetota bacterium]